MVAAAAVEGEVVDARDYLRDGPTGGAGGVEEVAD
jgi:3-isopropylmalate/(R)-2-methylmalate dehydratase large subunit